MDNNQPVTPNPVSPQPATPAPGATPQTPPVQNLAQPTTTPQAQTPVPPKGVWNKKWLWIGGMLIIVGLSLSAAYWFIGRQTPKEDQQTVQATPKPAAKKQQDNFEQDLNNIKIDESDAEFASLDQDLQGL